MNTAETQINQSNEERQNLRVAGEHFSRVDLSVKYFSLKIKISEAIVKVCALTKIHFHLLREVQFDDFADSKADVVIY